MLPIPQEYASPCQRPGEIETLKYGEKSLLLYTPIKPASRILYLIHGGGGDETSFFRPAFRNLVDHMIEKGDMNPMYIVTPCFYDAGEKDKTPGSSGVAVSSTTVITGIDASVVPLSCASATSSVIRFCSSLVWRRSRRYFRAFSRRRSGSSEGL